VIVGKEVAAAPATVMSVTEVTCIVIGAVSVRNVVATGPAVPFVMKAVLLVGYIVEVKAIELLAEEIATKLPPETSCDTVRVVVNPAGSVVLVVKGLRIVVSSVPVKVVVDTKDPVNVVVGKLLAGAVEVEMG
jgi:hypothetical protein